MTFSHSARRMLALAISIALSGAMLAAHATDAPLTLEDAVQRGVADAPSLKARTATIAAMQEDAVRAGRLPDPTLAVGINNYPITAPGAFSLRSDPMTMRTVGFTQAIPSRAAREADRSLAAAQIDAADAESTDTTQAVQERIANAWIDLWSAQQRRAVLETLRHESVLAVQIAEARLRGGDGSATDTLAAHADTVALDNRVEGADADIAAAQAGLQHWLAETVTTLGSAPDFSHLRVAATQLEATIDQQAPMQVWQAREHVAQAALEQARATRHPDWNVSVQYGQRATGLSDMVMVQVGVSLPLFTRNRQDRNISAREEAWDAARDAHEEAYRGQREAIARAVAGWQGWGRQIERYQNTLLPLARDRASTALAAYRGGSSLQPWLDARRDEIELHLNYVDALAARARLWAALAYLLPTSAAEATP